MRQRTTFSRHRTGHKVFSQMFNWLFFPRDEVEIPVSDREFELLLVTESPPAAPAQSLAYDDEEPASSSAPLNAMQMMFDQKKFQQNFVWFQFHNAVCGKLC